MSDVPSPVPAMPTTFVLGYVTQGGRPSRIHRVIRWFCIVFAGVYLLASAVFAYWGFSELQEYYRFASSPYYTHGYTYRIGGRYATPRLSPATPPAPPLAVSPGKLVSHAAANPHWYLAALGGVLAGMALVGGLRFGQARWALTMARVSMLPLFASAVFLPALLLCWAWFYGYDQRPSELRPEAWLLVIPGLLAFFPPLLIWDLIAVIRWMRDHPMMEVPAGMVGAYSKQGVGKALPS